MVLSLLWRGVLTNVAARRTVGNSAMTSVIRSCRLSCGGVLNTREETRVGKITRTLVLVVLTFLLVACETAQQKAQRIEAERQQQAQAQAQQAEADRARQAAEAERKLREELGDEIAVNVKHWAGAGENVQGSPMFGYHGTTPLLPTAYHEYEQGIGFKITNPQMFVKRSTGVVTIVFDCQFYGPNKYQDGHGVPIPFMVRLFDENGQYITHFTTEERFASPATYSQFKGLGMKSNKLTAEHNVVQYRISRRDAEYTQRGEFGFLV